MEDKTPQVQQNSSDKSVSFGLSPDNIPNMAPLYRKLLNIYSESHSECPTLFIVDDSMIDIPYIKCSDNLILKRGVSLEKTMTEDNCDISALLTSFGKGAYDIYRAALLACDILDIKCPIIVPINNTGGFNGIALQNRKCLTKIIQIEADLRRLDQLAALFHELRHAWQHEKNHKKYFRGYKFLGPGIDAHEYLMQPAELDANAFSVYMMVSLGFEDYPVKRKNFDDVNKEIEKKAKKMNFPNW